MAADPKMIERYFRQVQFSKDRQLDYVTRLLAGEAEFERLLISERLLETFLENELWQMVAKSLPAFQPTGGLVKFTSGNKENLSIPGIG